MANIAQAERKFNEATAAYLRNLEEDGASVHTITNYASALAAFRDSWKDGVTRHQQLQDPSFTDIQRWKTELSLAGCKVSTIAAYLTRLSIFFNAVSDESLGESRVYKSNPIPRRMIPSTKKSSARPYDMILDDQDVMKLWRNNPINTTHPENWPRNYAIVILLLTTKIRNAELLSLTPDDLDFQNGRITIEHGKGDKFRIVDFPEIAQLAVRLYLSSPVRPTTASSCDVLFGTTGDGKLSGAARSGVWKKGTSQWLSSLVERHVRAVTGVEGVRTHDLRHVGARLDLNNGASIEELQRELGHSNITTTQIYCGKLMPRADMVSANRTYAERDRQTEKLRVQLAEIC